MTQHAVDRSNERRAVPWRSGLWGKVLLFTLSVAIARSGPLQELSPARGATDWDSQPCAGITLVQLRSLSRRIGGRFHLLRDWRVFIDRPL